MSRRTFLRLGAATGAGLYAGMAGGRFGTAGTAAAAGPGPPRPPRPRLPSPSGLRRPGSRLRPDLPAGTDTFPGIEHIIVLMMENHSFDNYLGALGRGDGLTFGPDHLPVNANPDAAGHQTRSFPLATTCQTLHLSEQSWNASHQELGTGHNDGFVRTAGPATMGYWAPANLPFYAGLARTFPLADRWFASCLGPTHPNRRFLIAGTSAGLVHNRHPISTDPPPANGTIFNLLDRYGRSWRNYYLTTPTAGLFMSAVAQQKTNLVPVKRFFDDARSGSLPNFAIIDPDYGRGSEESPMDVSVGEAFAASVINAVLRSPAWSKSLLVWCYDEHGGYYDHVPPPAAVRPDSIAPQLAAGDTPAGFDRYGFRVPAVVVSPYARPNYVSHVVHDHTSVLKLVETKWNLPAMTYRDANASDLLDCLDLRRPAFAEPPNLPAPANPGGVSRCQPRRALRRGTSQPSGSDESGAATTLAVPTSSAVHVTSGRLDTGEEGLLVAAAVIGATAATAAVGRTRLLRLATDRHRDRGRLDPTATATTATATPAPVDEDSQAAPTPTRAEDATDRSAPSD